MALAWATVALLVLLLPGFAFLGGLTTSEQFSRETAPRNPLAQLALIVFISFLVHGLLYAALIGCSSGARCVRTDYVFAAFQLSGADKIPLEMLGEAIRESRWKILGYVLGATVAGAALGILAGKGVLRGWWGVRALTQHRWVFELNPQPHQRKWAHAYVVSDLEGGGSFVIYHGLLVDFGLGIDGRFSYLVIRKPYRRTLHVGAGEATLTPSLAVQPRLADATDVAAMRLRFLVIEAAHIKNFFFAPFELAEEQKQDVEQLNKTLAAAAPAPPDLAARPEMFEPGDPPSPPTVDPPVPGASSSANSVQTVAPPDAQR